MIIRPPTEAEYPQAIRIRDIAFLRQRETDAALSFTEYEVSRSRCAFDEAGQMTATLRLHDFTCGFDGNLCRMGGIGAVSTLVEHRRQGYIRGLMEHVLREMYDEGYAFSSLYPFSHPFYRRFGYELCGARRRVRFPIRCIPRLPSKGRLSLHQPGEPIGDVQAVYAGYTEAANWVIQRTDLSWRVWEQDPVAGGQFAYRWINDQGETRAYVVYKTQSENNENLLYVTDMAWLDKEGLLGLFSLFCALDSRYQSVDFRIPDQMDPYALLPEPYDVSLKLSPAVMVRIVNVERALSLMRRPIEPCQVVLDVRDEQLAENNAVFVVRYDHSGVSVARDPQAAPDVSLSIQALTQWVGGSHGPGIWPAPQGQADIHGNAQTLAKVFTPRPIYLVEPF